MRGGASACLLVVLRPVCTEKRDSRETVTFWVMGFEGQQVARLLPEFERRNPGIHVDLQQMPVLSAHEKLLTAFAGDRSEEHTSELQSLMRISYAVFCLKKKNHNYSFIEPNTTTNTITSHSNHHH